MKQLLLFVMTLLPMMVNANDLSDNGIYYKIKSDGSLEVMGSSTANVDIPSSITISGTKYRVTSIGAYAFEGRSDITYLSIPYSIKSIGEYAFMGCGSSMTVNIADPESWCQMQLGNEHASPLSSAGKMLVHDIETERIDIPEEVTSIGAFTFYQCSCLKSLSIPGTVTSIGSSAFEDCDYLTSLSLGEGLQSIGGSAFEGCKRLTNLVLPSTVNSILMNAFKNCVGLTDVYCFAANVPSTDNSAFTSVATENVALHVPDNAANAYKSTWPWSNFKGSIDMSKSRTIHVGVAGTLSNYISAGEIQNVEELTLTGYLNGTDIGFIRRMAGAPLNYSMADEVYEEAERGHIYGKLTALDISDAIIVSGGDSYYNVCWDIDDGKGHYDIREAYFTSNNTISEYMFRDCKFTKVSLPNNIMEIGDCAFSNCESLTSIDIPQSVTSIGSGAFYCTGWYYNQPDGLAYAGKVAYKYKGEMPANTKITLKDGTQGIAGSAFYGCRGLTSITIPNSVTSIGSDAFSGTGWYNNQPDGLVYAGKVAYKYKGEMPANTKITLKDGTQGIAGSAFDTCYGLTSVTIPNSVTTIGEKAFNWCPSLTSITIGNSVASIGDGAFRGCSSLTSVTTPNSVTSIGQRAFRDCRGLTSVTIGNSVTSIGDEAFYGCSGLTSVHISNLKAWCGIKFSRFGNPLYFAHHLYLNGEEIKDLVIPKSGTSIGDYAFDGCSGLTSVTIPNSVTSIGEFAFSSCRGLTSVTIPNSVTSISYGAFSGCSGLTSVIIGNSVTSIGDEAFYRCSGLTSVTIPNSVESIGSYAFSGCSGLTSIKVESGNQTYDSHNNCNAIIEKSSNTLIAGCKNTIIPNSVTSISSYAFSGCSGLTSVTIPNSVESIGFGAFFGCSGLSTIISEIRNPFKISEYLFDSYDKTTLIVPKGSKTKYKTTAGWSKFTNIMEIIDGDVNLDGKVNDADVKDIANYIMGMTPEGFYKNAADVNKDNKVNVADIVLINKMR